MERDQPRHTGLEARVADIVTPTLAHLGYELVRVMIFGRDRPTVQIMVERADGAPVGIEDCQRVSEVLGAVIDVEDPMQGAWTLEVSSPGIDRPLTRMKDWNRFSGHRARVDFAEPLDGRRRVTGIVLGADDQVARMRTDDGTELVLPLTNVRRAKLVLTDELIAATASHPRN
ncbi:MAG: ribosome maturation factor RimP [Acidisphaera sp.]|nr:ribosome maturation factor RimP [Acidisphaera sp.]